MRFPGEPAIPGGKPLVHSLVLSEFELLVAKDVVETASSSGEAIGGLSLEGGEAALISGDWIGGEGLVERPLAPFPLLADSQLETLLTRARSRPTRTWQHASLPPRPLRHLLCHSSCLSWRLPTQRILVMPFCTNGRIQQHQSAKKRAERGDTEQWRGS